MNERDPREELADIAASVRRYVEREDASGAGEILTYAARAAMRVGETAVAPVTVPAEVPTPVAADVPPSGETDPLVLFEGKAKTADRFADYHFDLPPAHPPLHPNDLESRAQIHSLALPVLDGIAAEARACKKCGLCETRKQAVPGVGSAQSGIVFVGEAPGADEDAQGEPFVGRAGQLLTQIIKAMDEKQLIPGVPLNRQSVYICNVLKCRPPENRNPLPHEIEACSPYLKRQLEVMKPRIICCLGKFAAELLVGVKGTIAGLRGKIYRYHGAKLIVTYHPAACLRNPNYKRPVWEDMQLLAREYLA
jgi:uracil-DNA glycosylase family 4